ncbi:MAG: DUF2442 domain-containing protein [Magnetococcales bacterium]|nr:DUF2442 domain-containing protein [Magnetococcales bacterium]
MDRMAPNTGERVEFVSLTAESLRVGLMNGREVTAPLACFPKLSGATPAQRDKWETCGGGYGIHWEELDEDLSTEGLLRGAPAPRSGPIR